jgi:hypothetical protein
MPVLAAPEDKHVSVLRNKTAIDRKDDLVVLFLFVLLDR